MFTNSMLFIVLHYALIFIIISSNYYFKTKKFFILSLCFVLVSTEFVSNKHMFRITAQFQKHIYNEIFFYEIASQFNI